MKTENTYNTLIKIELKDFAAINRRIKLNPHFKAKSINQIDLQKQLLDWGFNPKQAKKKEYQDFLLCLVANCLINNEVRFIEYSGDNTFYSKSSSVKNIKFWTKTFVKESIKNLLNSKILIPDQFEISSIKKQEESICSLFLFSYEFRKWVMSQDWNIETATHKREEKRPTPLADTFSKSPLNQDRFFTFDDLPNATFEAPKNYRFTECGRLTHEYMTMPKMRRMHIVFPNGEKGEETDIGSCLITMLYDYLKIPRDHIIDMYQINDMHSRDTWKSLVIQALFCKDENQYFRSISNMINHGEITDLQNKKTVVLERLAMIKEFHKGIAYRFFQDNRFLFEIEGRIGEKVLKAFEAKGLMLISIYDAFLVAKSHTEILKQEIKKAWQEVLNTPNIPTLKTVSMALEGQEATQYSNNDSKATEKELEPLKIDLEHESGKIESRALTI